MDREVSVPRAEDANADLVAWIESRQHRLLRAAYLLTGDLHRAEDLLQEALVKLAGRWDRVRDGNPDAYVRTIIYRDNVSWWRSRREFPVPLTRDLPGRHDADATERTIMVRSALASLTSKQRAVLVLRYFEDLSEREAAQILGVSVGTVKSQTAVALTRLRQRAPDLAEFLGKKGGTP
ncbi:MAG: SigE family RNA polymerase sigma factor [Actinomycetota bacterium]|nr:SigE family RNA polymerase sigma factor [Actinomycetota bacterium]